MRRLAISPTVEALTRALDESELYLVYQPVFDLRNGEVVGAEALVRWRHPLAGSVPPDVFLPVAREGGLMVAIGRWVLRTACAHAALWHRTDPVRVTVNVSADELDDPQLPSVIRIALATTGLPPEALTLEVTEAVLARDLPETARTLASLKQLGVRLALDYGGTNHSSLSQLAQLPIDAIKIDRSFIADGTPPAEAFALIRLIVKIGKLLGLETLGEGIENEAQLDRLRRLDCDAGQGFLLAPPLLPAHLTSVLAGEAAALAAVAA